MGFIGMVGGAEGRMLPVREVFSGVFMISLAEDQVKSSEVTADVVLGGAETDTGFPSAATGEF